MKLVLGTQGATLLVHLCQSISLINGCSQIVSHHFGETYYLHSNKKTSLLSPRELCYFLKVNTSQTKIKLHNTCAASCWIISSLVESTLPGEVVTATATVTSPLPWKLDGVAGIESTRGPVDDDTT
jgi:hypothetical protein